MFLTNKVGPLPVWGYGAIAGGGLLLMKMSKGKQPAGNGDPNNPNGVNNQYGAPAATNATMYGGSGNIYGGGGYDPTFGGGSLGMYSWPYFGGGSMFVNLFRHPFGDSWRHGHHDFPFHAFDRQPFFNFGGLFGDFDRGRGFGHGDGDRGRSWGNDPYQYPRGGDGGHFGPGGDNGRASRFVDNNASSPGNHVR